jgi:hypothetical protein
MRTKIGKKHFDVPISQLEMAHQEDIDWQTKSEKCTKDEKKY